MAGRARRDVTADLVARGIVAKVLSHALADPDDGTREYLKGRAVADLERASGLVSTRSRLRTAMDGLRDALSTIDGREATAMFAAAGAPPYETEYGMAHVFMKVQTMADVAGFYRGFGLAPAEDARERPDHLAAEIEFLHFLLLHEAMARTQGRQEEAKVSRRARTTFLREHLGAWGPAYLEKVAGTDPRSPAARIARIAARFLRAEAHRVRAAVTTAPPVLNPQPSPEQERALCEPASRAPAPASPP